MSSVVVHTPRFADVPVFAGQGTAAASSPQTREQALRDAESASGTLLLTACYQAFLTEFASLSPTEMEQVDIDPADFDTVQSLLAALPARYQRNTVFATTTLFLIQSLRYLAHIESLSTEKKTSPFADYLKSNAAQGLGVLGFSSGILPACVVGTSNTTVSYIAHAVEAYRLAFWIGVRCQLYRVAALEAEDAPGKECTLPWSLVFMGMNKKVAQDAIEEFQRKNTGLSPLYITAVMDDSSVTISGRPDVLAKFSAELPSGSSVHMTSITTLYHAPSHKEGVRSEILHDVIRRGIHFPTFAEIVFPIRSTYTGQLIDESCDVAAGYGTLVEAAVDMIVAQPVNWDIVVDEVIKALPAEGRIALLNLGPGAGMARSMERAFPKDKVVSIDISTRVAREASKIDTAKYEPIAVVGMAVNMPGAPNTNQLWEVLEKGINTISEVPSDRFDVRDYNDPKDPKTNRQMKAHTGNFLSNADQFDNKFFKISPREARSMDPQQRVLLHVAYEALENAGYVPNATETFAQDSFGCYIGVATNDYVQNLRNDIDVYYSTGTLRAFLSGRISYAFQWSGPSLVIDTACSSSMVAIYQACRALMNRDCNAALAGGVNVISSPDMFLGLDRGHFLSPTGQCKAFDASADGYSRSEGCGLFVLKRLSDAIAEGDNIMGVIRGIDVNQSGNAHSITHPHAPTQATLFKRVLEATGIDPTRINVVEAHGTGTQAGDPNELESIRSIFAIRRAKENPLHITSIKANIGHLEAASGSAGLAKLLLMLRHRAIPRQVSLKNLNPRIAPLEADNTIIDREMVPWEPSQPGLPRIAMLNNFGAAGSNGTMLLEEFPAADESKYEPAGLAYLFGLSAKTDTALNELKKKYVDWLQDPASDDVRFADIAYTATARRIMYAHRTAVVATDKKDLIQKLESTKLVAVPGESKPSKTVFVFSGQGGQYLGMGGELYRTNPLFKHHIDECHEVLRTMGFPGVTQIIATESGESGLSKLEEFEAYQGAIFALEYALAKLWMSWGVKPDAVVGHSLGEYAALVIAGVLTLKGALTIVANRVRLMVTKCATESTGMIAINQGPAAVKDILQSNAALSGCSIACYNSAGDCVVAGPLEQLKALKAHLDSEVKCKNVLLSVPFGYHSTAMEPLLDDLISVAKRVTLRPPTLAVISNVFGEVVRPGDASVFTSEYFARHCAEPVQFERGINAFCATSEFANVGLWVEIGPHPTTLPMLKSNPSVPKDGLLLPSIRKNQDVWLTLMTSLSQLYTTDRSLAWREVFAHVPAVKCVDAPSYPFSPSRFWIDYKEEAPGLVASDRKTLTSSARLVSESSMLHAWAQEPSAANGNVAIFETPIEMLAGSIRGHSVGGMPLCPASVYIEQVLAGVQLAREHLGLGSTGHHLVVKDVQFAHPLVYAEGVARLVKTKITLDDGAESGNFTVSSSVDGAEESVHVHGTFRLETNTKTTTKFGRVAPVIHRQMATVATPVGPGYETFSTRTAYEVIFPRVVDYSREYHTMQSLTVDPSGMEGYAVVKLPADHFRGRFIVHPVFMDTLLHVAGFVANMQGGINDAYICSQVDSVKVIPDLVDNDATYGVFCRNAWLADEGVMLADAYAVELTGAKRIVGHLKGMHFRRVRLTSLKKGLQMASGRPAEVTPSRVTFAPSKPSSHKVVSRTPSSSSTSSSTVHDVQAAVVGIIAETCGIDPANVKLETCLDSLGVDSLMSIEIFGKLQASYSGADLNAQALSACHTVGELAQAVASRVPEAKSGASSPRTLVEDEKVSEPALVGDEEPDVKGLLASVLGIPPKEITDDADFDALGLDSLTSIEALQALRTEFGLDLPSNFFQTNSTPKAVESYLQSHLRAKVKAVEMTAASKVVETVQSNLNSVVNALRLHTLPLPLQVSKSNLSLPLFLVHDGSGLVNYYERLSPLDRNIWGIHNPNFITGQAYDSVVAMASEYADLITKTASGPILLGGWSFGGVAAFEIARQLLRKGVPVKGVLLIDSPSPVNHVPLSQSLIEAVVNLDARGANSDIGRLVKAQFEKNSALLGKYDPVSAGGPFPPLVLLRSREGFNPSGVKEPVPTWLADRSNAQQAVAGWEGLVGATVKSIDIPGNHFEPFHASNIAEVSCRIADGCQYLESL